MIVKAPEEDLRLYDDFGWNNMFTNKPGFVHLDGTAWAVSMV
jgi:hypothetical protein